MDLKALNAKRGVGFGSHFLVSADLPKDGELKSAATSSAYGLTIKEDATSLLRKYKSLCVSVNCLGSMEAAVLIQMPRSMLHLLLNGQKYEW